MILKPAWPAIKLICWLLCFLKLLVNGFRPQRKEACFLLTQKTPYEQGINTISLFMYAGGSSSWLPCCLLHSRNKQLSSFPFWLIHMTDDVHMRKIPLKNPWDSSCISTNSFLPLKNKHWLNSYSVLGLILNTWKAHLILTTTLEGRHYDRPHFTDQETEARRVEVICLRSNG